MITFDDNYLSNTLQDKISCTLYVYLHIERHVWHIYNTRYFKSQGKELIFISNK